MAEGLTPLQAYQQVMRFAALRGEGALRLAMHAAVPQVLRPELVHLLRLNFVPESLADTSLEADVLFAPFCEDLGNGYFRFDANARQRLLVHLDPAYEGNATLRSRQVAGFVLTHFDEPGHRVTSSHDPVYEAYLEVERWVALAFLDQDAAAAQLAAVVRDACDTEAVVAKFRVAGLTSALSTPLARHHSLLAYAAGVEMLQRGDVSAAREVLESLGDSEIEVAGVRLPVPSTVLREPKPRWPEAAAQEVPEAQAERDTPAVTHPRREQRRLEFYFCYARATLDNHLKRFFDDLSLEVGTLTGDSYRDAGFMDHSGLEPVDYYSATVVDAISRTKSVVAVLSPAFFKSDYCSRELGLFEERLHLAALPTALLIKPVQWVPGKVPAAFQRLGLDFGDPNGAYSSKGLRHVLRQQPQLQAEYNALISELAADIVRSGRENQLPPLQNPPALADVVPFWPAGETEPDPRVQAPPPIAPAPGRVFISYIRGDAAGYAGRLCDYLRASFSPNSIVMDVDISPDEDFRTVIARTVESASVVLVIIGQEWLLDKDENARRRLSDADDFVQIEIAAALGAGVPVLPILVNGARMPPQSALPRGLAGLADHNAFELRNDRWKDDVRQVAEIIRQLQNSPRGKEPGSTRARRRIFVSGNQFALPEYRKAVRDVLQQLGYDMVTVEDFHPTKSPRPDEIQSYLAGADAMLLLLGWRSGYVPAEGNPEGRSINEIEYRAARERGIPVFAYSATEGSRASATQRRATAEQDRARTARFLELVRTNHHVGRFKDAASLAEQIMVDVSRWEVREVSTATTAGISVDQRPHLSGPEPAPELRGPVLIFAGHVIDPPALAMPRFPADKEDIARNAIRAMVQQELMRTGRFACAMASASKGADILFHEVCLELGIEARVYLPVSVKRFATTFIGRSDGSWLDRFNRLATQERVRTTMRATPSRRSAGGTDWLHNAETMFKDAKEIGGSDVTLIVLWDELQTRSPGAVGDFVKLAKQATVRVESIDSRRLFGLDPEG